MAIHRVLSSTLLPRQTRHLENFIRTCFNQPQYKLDSRYYSHIYISTDSNELPQDIESIVPTGMLCVRHCNYIMMLRSLDDECKRQKNGSAVNDIVGYFQKPPSCDISLWNLCVVPERRRQKIAEQLMLTSIHDNLVELPDYDCLRFQLYVGEDNVAAIRLYEKLGFRVELRDTRQDAPLLKMYRSFVFGRGNEEKA